MSPITVPDQPDYTAVDVDTAADVLDRLPTLIKQTRTARQLTAASVAKTLRTTSAVLLRWENGDMTSANYAQIGLALEWIASGQ
jgi:DNA-binding transcriptional regulator YiaG